MALAMCPWGCCFGLVCLPIRGLLFQIRFFFFLKEGFFLKGGWAGQHTLPWQRSHKGYLGLYCLPMGAVWAFVTCLSYGGLAQGVALILAMCVPLP